MAYPALPWKSLISAACVASSVHAADNAAYLQISGTDALSRTIASPETVGPKRTGRAVGVFYFLVSGYWNDAVSGPFNLDQILGQGGIDARLNPLNPAWNGSDGHKLYWGEPLLGYYRSHERWAVRRNMQMLTLAGIDFIVLDYTNTEATSSDVNGAARVVMEEIEALRSQGWNPPRVAFYTNTNSGTNASLIYDTFYAPAAPNRFPNTWYQVDGKPLLIGKSSDISTTIASNFTLRESQWPNAKDANGNFLQHDGGFPWIEFTRPQRVYSKSGVRDAISVSVAQHAEDVRMSTFPFYGLDLNWGRGYAYGSKDHSLPSIRRGSNFEEQWSHALAQDVPFTFVTGWNEGGAGRIVEDEATLGWVGGGSTSDCGYQTGGTFGCTITGNDPSVYTVNWLYSPQGQPYTVSSTVNNRVRIEFSNTWTATSTATSDAQLFFTTTSVGGFVENSSVRLAVSQTPGFQTLEFDLSNALGWSDTLKQLRFDPPSWNNSGTFSIRRVSLLTANGAIAATWDFGASSNFTNGWVVGNAITGFGRQSSGRVGGTISGSDPFVQSAPGIGTSLDANKFVRIRMRNGTSDAMGQVYFTTTADRIPSESKSRTFAITPNDPNFTDYVIDMSSVSGWNGTLEQLRLDPAVNASNGTFSVDHIRIGPSSANAMPAVSWDFGPTHMMIDAADTEFSRDMEPSRGALGDNYFMQLVDFTRKQAGTESRKLGSTAKTISISGAFTQWDDVSPGFKDFTGDVDARNSAGVGTLFYSSSTGRNDFELAKVARNSSNVYFYIRTAANITSNTGANWMQLFIDVDGNRTNGFLGYDYVVNRTTPNSATSANLERCRGGWSWEKVGNVSYRHSGRELHLAIPRSLLGAITDPIAIRFKWLDNVSGQSPLAFYTNGDAAPDGRFSYEYASSNSALIHPKGSAITTSSYSASSAYLPASNANGSGSFWSTYGLAATQTAWLEIDLGTPKPVGGLEVAPRPFNRVGTAFPRDFEFQYKDANGLWQTVPGATYRDYPTPGTKPIFFPFTKPVSSRNFRWVGTRHRYDDGGTTFFMQASGFKAYSPTGSSWEFEQSVDGWSSAGTSGILSASGGTVTGTITGSDPQMISSTISGLNVSPTSNNRIRIKYRNQSASTTAQIYFLPLGGQWSETNSKTFPVVSNDGISREYVIDMGGVSGWNGNVQQLRFDPSMATSGSYTVDHFRIQSARTPAISWEYADKPSDFGGWFRNGSVSPLTWNAEGSISGTITATDPAIYSQTSLGTDISSAKFVRIRMRNRTSDNQAQIYFVTETATGWSETKSVVFPIVPNDTEYREYVVNMGVNSAWTGILRQLRLDPCRTASAGGFDLDHIRIQSW